MDPSKIYGGHHAEEEECQSSESGWTMYLGSCLDGENNHHQHDSDDDHHDGKAQGYCHKDDSDDSMVSDASSRPSTHQRSRSVHAAGKQEEKAKTKKQSASGAARMRREYSKASEKKAKIINSKAK